MQEYSEDITHKRHKQHKLSWEQSSYNEQQKKFERKKKEARKAGREAKRNVGK